MLFGALVETFTRICCPDNGFTSQKVVEICSRDTENNKKSWQVLTLPTGPYTFILITVFFNVIYSPRRPSAYSCMIFQFYEWMIGAVGRVVQRALA